jgi:NAD(P)-dependent dehydrogenase (short-subunit alcohol dehydrogenase family)
MGTLLEGRTAIVTGSSKGVGKGIALELAAQGSDIVVNYQSDRGAAEAAAAEIRSLGRKAIVVQANVGCSEDVAKLFCETLSSFPRLDILVNNAGVQTWKALLDLEENEWDRVLDTNLKGCFLCTRAAASHMKNNGGGRIINIGSGCNKIAFPHLVDYTASKGGIEQLTKVAAVELGKYNITVNCVAPGAVEIERTRLEVGDYAGTWASLTPLGRVGVPRDVGQVVVFLASAMADFVTGQTIWVDGGLFSKPQWPYEI